MSIRHERSNRKIQPREKPANSVNPENALAIRWGDRGNALTDAGVGDEPPLRYEAEADSVRYAGQFGGECRAKYSAENP